MQTSHVTFLAVSVAICMKRQNDNVELKGPGPDRHDYLCLFRTDLLTEIDEHLRERCKEAASGGRRHLCCVHRGDHKSVSHTDAGHETPDHQESVAGGEAH